MYTYLATPTQSALIYRLGVQSILLFCERTKHVASKLSYAHRNSGLLERELWTGLEKRQVKAAPSL